VLVAATVWNPCCPVPLNGCPPLTNSTAFFRRRHSADPCIYINRMVQDIDTLALISPDMASDPTLFRSRGKFEQCPRCGSDDSVFFQTLANREKVGLFPRSPRPRARNNPSNHRHRHALLQPGCDLA